MQQLTMTFGRLGSEMFGMFISRNFYCFTVLLCEIHYLEFETRYISTDI